MLCVYFCPAPPLLLNQSLGYKWRFALRTQTAAKCDHPQALTKKNPPLAREQKEWLLRNLSDTDRDSPVCCPPPGFSISSSWHLLPRLSSWWLQTLATTGAGRMQSACLGLSSHTNSIVSLTQSLGISPDPAACQPGGGLSGAITLNHDQLPYGWPFCGSHNEMMRGARTVSTRLLPR